MPAHNNSHPARQGPLIRSFHSSSNDVRIADVPDTVSAILNLPKEFGRRNILSLRPDEPRERRHYHYQDLRGEWKLDYLLPIQEFIINGDVYSSASWRIGDWLPSAPERE